MNLCWIVPKKGESHMRDVQSADRKELLAAGFEEYRFTHQYPDGFRRSSHLYAARAVERADIEAGDNALFGGSGTVECVPTNGR